MSSPQRITIITRECTAAARMQVGQNTVRVAARANEGETPTASDYSADVIGGEAGEAWNRLLTLTSQRNLAFDAEITWSAGGGVGGTFTVTATGGAVRVPLYATTVQIKVANWTNIATSIRGNIQDGLGQGNYSLHRIERAVLNTGAGVEFSVPPYAVSVQVGISNPALAGGITTKLLDTFGNTVASYSGVNQRIDIGMAQKVRIENASGTNLSSVVADFLLGL